MQSAWAHKASVVAAVVASACCRRPLVLLVLGFSAADMSVAFAAMRPLLLTLSAGLLVLALLLHFARKHAYAPGSPCPEPSARERRLSRLGLLVATTLVLLVGLFPDYSGLITGSRQRAVGAAEAGTRMRMTLMIEGITCAACTVDVQQALAALPGVQDVSVNYPEG